MAWRELRFESKSQSNQPFDNWVTRVLSDSNISKMTSKVIGLAWQTNFPLVQILVPETC